MQSRQKQQKQKQKQNQQGIQSILVNQQQVVATKTETIKGVYQHNVSLNPTYACSQDNNNRNTNKTNIANTGGALHHKTAHLGRHMP